MTKKKLGIWMDCSSAMIIDFSGEQTETQTINSKFTGEVKYESINMNEHIMQNNEQKNEAEYYSKLGDIIKRYEEVVIFGPTNAKIDLYNILKTDHHFDKIKIKTINSDNMTVKQQFAYVSEHFSK